MQHRTWTAQEGICDFPLVMVIAAVVLGLGSVAAELSSPISDPRLDRASVGGTLAGAPTLATRPPFGRPRDEPAGRTPFAAPAARARSLPAVPADLAPREDGDDDPRSFLIHMTDVLYGRGQPLPADVGRLQSLAIIVTPTATTAPYRTQPITSVIEPSPS
jgi:hypothetical protein